MVSLILLLIAEVINRSMHSEFSFSIPINPDSQQIKTWFSPCEYLLNHKDLVDLSICASFPKRLKKRTEVMISRDGKDLITDIEV